MVGLKLLTPNHLGLITIIATLFVAANVKGEQGVHFDTEPKSDVFFLPCDDTSSQQWTTDFDEKDSPKKKIFKLPPESEVCLKSKKPITLNSLSTFVIKFYSDSSPDESGNIIVNLVPVDGSCPENECVWEVFKDPKYRKGEWVTAEHKFPLKSEKGYYVQLKADKPKGKFLLESLSIPNGVIHNLDEPLEKLNAADRLTYSNTTDAPSAAAGFGKNLLFTTASVLTLNNLLN